MIRSAGLRISVGFWMRFWVSKEIQQFCFGFSAFISDVSLRNWKPFFVDEVVHQKLIVQLIGCIFRQHL